MVTHHPSHHTQITHFSDASRDRVYSSSVTSERAIHQPLQPVLLHNCPSKFFPDIYHSSSFLQFTPTTTFFLPLFTNERSLILLLCGTTEFTETPQQEIQSSLVSRMEQNKVFRYVSESLEHANAV